MEKQNHERWFSIKHNKCGSIFTIGINSYLESQIHYPQYLRCPNCREKIIRDEHFMEFTRFLSEYKKLIESFREANSSIHEIQADTED